MHVNMSIPGCPNVTITMFNDVEDQMRVDADTLKKQPSNQKRYQQRRHFHIARARLGVDNVFPVN